MCKNTSDDGGRAAAPPAKQKRDYNDDNNNNTNKNNNNNNNNSAGVQQEQEEQEEQQYSIGNKTSSLLLGEHLYHDRNDEYDWLLFFLGPGILFCFVTNVIPMYMILLCRLFVIHSLLSLHYIWIDKDNYFSKLSQQQLDRERKEYSTPFYMHMWIQVLLQLIFPNMFFPTNTNTNITTTTFDDDYALIMECTMEIFICHILIVEPLYYIVHRWLHTPAIYNKMHQFHHLSINTLPTTSSVQNIIEHVIYVCTFGPAFFIPYVFYGRQHWISIGIYLVTFDILNNYGHTNMKVRHWLFNSRYSPITYLLYTPEFHLGHHYHRKVNYTLFMPLWDAIFGTYIHYEKKEQHMLPYQQQDFVFIGHNAGLSHFLTIPEICIYNVYNQYRIILPSMKLDFFIMHCIGIISRFFFTFYYCSRFCVHNQYIARIIVLARTPWDYMSTSTYPTINNEIITLIKRQHQKYGTRYFGLGNLNKMKQLNDGGKDVVTMIQNDTYLKDKNIRIWTGDTMTVASVLNQVLDVPNLNDQLYYIGAGGKVGTALCELLIQERPNIKIRIFSRNHILLPKYKHNISYSNDLSEMAQYEVVLVGKILSSSMYDKALKKAGSSLVIKTRLVMDYTVPAFPIVALMNANIYHVRIGILESITGSTNPFLKGTYDVCMSHDENQIVPCHFGCLINMISKYEYNEVGDIDIQRVHKLWKLTLKYGYHNKPINYPYHSSNILASSSSFNNNNDKTK